jgi:site-specific recombinase XerD
VLKAFFRWCASAKLLGEDPAKDIKPPKVDETQVMPFTDDELKKILAVCKPKMRALVLLMRYSGLRIRDAVTLQKDRIRDGVLTLRTEGRYHGSLTAAS